MIHNKDMEISSWLGLEARPGWAIFEMCTFLDRFKNTTVPIHIFNTFVCQTSLDNIVGNDTISFKFNHMPYV